VPQRWDIAQRALANARVRLRASTRRTAKGRLERAHAVPRAFVLKHDGTRGFGHAVTGFRMARAIEARRARPVNVVARCGVERRRPTEPRTLRAAATGDVRWQLHRQPGRPDNLRFILRNLSLLLFFPCAASARVRSGGRLIGHLATASDGEETTCKPRRKLGVDQCARHGALESSTCLNVSHERDLHGFKSGTVLRVRPWKMHRTSMENRTMKRFM